MSKESIEQGIFFGIVEHSFSNKPKSNPTITTEVSVKGRNSTKVVEETQKRFNINGLHRINKGEYIWISYIIEDNRITSYDIIENPNEIQKRRIIYSYSELV